MLNRCQVVGWTDLYLRIACTLDYRVYNLTLLNHFPGVVKISNFNQIYTYVLDFNGVTNSSMNVLYYRWLRLKPRSFQLLQAIDCFHLKLSRLPYYSGALLLYKIITTDVMLDELIFGWLKNSTSKYQYHSHMLMLEIIEKTTNLKIWFVIH